MREPTGKIIAFAIALLVIVSGCATVATRPAVDRELAVTERTLVVGLYPYVPRLDQFQGAITAEWSKVRPDLSLRFLSVDDWDGGYSDDPPPQADVYVFDAMFFEYFRSQGWLEPMGADEIDDLDDFVAYAIDGVEVDGQYYAIPQLGCANILFYQGSDTALANATTLSEVEAALSQCTYTSETPPDRRGLMIDMSGGTTNAALYLDTLHSLTGESPLRLPWTESEINPTAMSNMRLLLAMASYENGTASLSAPYGRGEWFSNGWGRAVVGFTESMSAMSQQTRAGIGFKVLPLSDDDKSSLFYADVIAVNTTTHQRDTRALAVQLANVMASSATMLASIGPDSDSPYPQYLMATRPSIFQALGRSLVRTPGGAAQLKQRQRQRRGEVNGGRVDLEVPFAEKDEAKSLGAPWDPACKTSYVPAGLKAEYFQRWFSSRGAASIVSPAPPSIGSSHTRRE